EHRKQDAAVEAEIADRRLDPGRRQQRAKRRHEHQRVDERADAVEDDAAPGGEETTALVAGETGGRNGRLNGDHRFRSPAIRRVGVAEGLTVLVTAADSILSARITDVVPPI